MADDIACGNCRFYFYVSQTLRPSGECRCLPPHPLQPPHHMVDGGLRVFPRVFTDDWCGTHEAKNPGQPIRACFSGFHP